MPHLLTPLDFNMSDSNKDAQPQAGIKYDSDKLRMDLIDPFFVEGVARVLTFGSNKYGDHQWKGGFPLDCLIASLQRHESELRKGILVDSESGIEHVYHAACNLMFIAYLIRTKKYKKNFESWE